MIKIAICDDDKLTYEMLEKKLYSYEEKLYIFRQKCVHNAVISDTSIEFFDKTIDR